MSKSQGFPILSDIEFKLTDALSLHHANRWTEAAPADAVADGAGMCSDLRSSVIGREIIGVSGP